MATARALLPLPYAVGLLLYEHYCFAEGGERLPFFFAANYGLNQDPAREVAAADHPHEDTAMLFSSGEHLHRVLHRILRADHTVATPGRLFRTNPARRNLLNFPCPVRTCVMRKVRMP
ncbi:hypothetical protein PYW08_002526 [Mythimna loreyi]|uniref:Uncharacterized protein n=1 Tax=Mythimna loreyi TaxID=667449 RepID=A0ACC2QI46_9NEOP|nr:hypothetical protein PYW08_002526 [Mythimna loreyi]